MSVGFIWGRMPSDRTKKVFDLAFEEAKNNSQKPIYILVPEKYTYEMEKKLSQRLLIDKDPNFRIRVVSFSTLSNIVFTNVSGLRDKKISKSARTMLVYKALEMAERELKTFRPSQNDLGLVDKLLDLIIEFKQNNMDVEFVKEMSLSVDDKALATKIDDIAKVYENYEKLMFDKYVDSEDRIELFSMLLGKYEPIKGSIVYIDEFTGFTPVQYKVIEKLILFANKVYFSIMTDMKNINTYSGVFAKTNATILRVNKFCIENGIERFDDIRVDHEEGYYKSKDLKFLEDEIRFFNPKSYDNIHNDELNIKIAGFENRHREVEYVASRILDLVKNKGYRYNQIMVASRELDSYAHITKSIFEDYKINYFLDDKISAKDNPILIFILSILEMKNSNYSYKAVFSHLKSGLVDIDKEELSILENYVLANGIRGKKWFEDYWSLPIVHIVEDDSIDLEFQEKVNGIRSRVVTPIKNLHEKLKGRNTVRDVCLYIYEYALEIGLDQRLAGLVENFEKNEYNYRAREYKQAWTIFIDVLDEMVEFMGDELISIERYSKFLELQFTGQELGIIPPSRDQVFVTGVERMKNPDTRVLFLLGTNEGVFPQIASDKSIITEMDKELLLKKGIRFDSYVITRMYDEEYLVYRAMSTARDGIYVTYPKGDFEGTSLVASSLVNKLKKMFPGLENEDVSRFAKDVGFKMASKEYQNKEDDNKSLSLGMELSDLIYGAPVFSVSRLEKFSSCPYSYFVRYGLRAKQREIYEFSPMDTGNYFHKLLELFLRKIRANGISWDDVDLAYIVREVDELSSRILDKKSSYILNTSEKYKYMVNRLNRTLIDSIDVIGRQVRSGKLKPRGLEVTFGINSDLEPIRLSMSGGKKGLINGKIDRVDSYYDREKNIEYVSVIDYKLSSPSVSLENIEAGLQMQLFMYMNALMNSKKFEHKKEGAVLKPAAILYSRVKSPSIELKNIETFIEDDLFLDIPSKESVFENEEIGNKILEENKLGGIVVKSKEVYRVLDNQFEDNVSVKSSILPISLTSSGEISKSQSGFDEDEFDIISRYVTNKALDIANDIYDGKIAIEPYKYGDKTGCDYCEYRAICQFDGSDYKRIRKIDKKIYKVEDIINKMLLFNNKVGKEGDENGK